MASWGLLIIKDYKLCRLFIGICFLFMPGFANGQDPFKLSWSYSTKDTVDNEEIEQLRFIHLDESYKTPALSNGGTYFFKLDITSGDTAEDRVIRINNPHLDSVFLFHNDSGSVSLISIEGNNFRKKDDLYIRYTQFTIPGSWKEVYFKTRFKKDVVFPVEVGPASKYNKSEMINFFRLGLYYGFVLMVISINIFFFFIFRDRKYVYYCIFLFFIALTLAFSDGLLGLITNNAWWLSHGDILMHLLVAPAGAIFATSFLEVDSPYPKAKWITLFLVTIMLSAYSFHLINGGMYAFLTGEIAGILVLSFYWFIGLFRFKQDIFARFFVIAYGLILVFAFDFFMVQKLGWNFLNMTHNQLKIASIIEMIVLSWAITHRVKLLHKEHKRYQEEISRFMQHTMNEDLRNPDNNEGSAEDIYERVKEKFNLSEREIEVLTRITEGLTNSQMGEELFLSANTVKFHIRNIYDKMQISSRAQAVSKLHESI